MHTGNVVTAWLMLTHDRLTQAAAQAGVGLRELSALTLIETHPGMTADWLRSRVGLSQPGTVRLIDRLVTEGLVQRSPRQGRTVGLAVTTAGQRLLRDWLERRQGALDGATHGFSPGEVRMLTDLLARAIEGTQRARPEADATCGTCDWPACGDDCPVDRSVTR
jgi:DNA-binding MarR family transcriptional regulator